jgi:PAS domain S-box-containing protein
MQPIAIGLYYCSESELAAVREQLPPSPVITFVDESEPCDFAIIGSEAVKRNAVIGALREKLGTTPALLLLDSADDDPYITDDLAVLAKSELHRLPYVIRRELRLNRTEVALRESERRYRELLESAHEGIWVFEPHGATTYANAKMAEILGLTIAELQRVSFFDCVDEPMRAFALTQLQRVATGVAETHELRFRRRNGTTLWAMVALSPVHDGRGEYCGALALVNDVTARHQIEEELRRRETQLSIAQHLAQIGSWQWDFEADRVTLSAELGPIIGRGHEPLPLSQALQYVHPSDRERIAAAMRRAAADGTLFDAEYRLLRRDTGEERIIHTRAQIVAGADGRKRMIGMAQDITDRKQHERMLEENELRLRTLVQKLPEVTWRDDCSHKLNFISANVEELWGFTPEELRESGFEIWSRHVHPADRDRVLKEYDALFTEGKRYDVEYRFRRKDGEWIWVHNRAEMAEIGGMRQAFGVISDVTARRRAADQLERSEARYRALFEQLTDIIYTVDSQGCITSLNPAFEAITGWKAEEWIGRHFIELIDPGDQHAAVAHFEAVLRGSSYQRDYRIRARDGGEVLIETTAQVLRIDGEVMGTIGIARDVTRRRQQDMQREKEKRLASLGQLAASVAHEFNNVLMSILPFAELIKRRVPNDERVETATRHIVQAIRRGRQVSQEILRLSRPASATLTVIDMRAWLTDFSREALAMLGPKYRVETHIDETLGPMHAHGDRALLVQAAMNLILNARDAMPEGGRVAIEVRRGAEGTVEIAVRDHGCGIPEQLLERIFDPLFTTKPSGTGLGLSIAYQAMVQQEGTLRVSSTVGAGSTFTIVLREAAAPVPAADAAVPRPRVRGRRVVLVEDDESVGEGIRALLIDEGFDVLLVTRGGEAVEAIERFAPEVVLLDVNLPDVSGLDIYEEVSRRWPELPVIFSTGHADARALDEVRRRDVPSIMKPYDIEELLEIMSRVRTTA